MTLTRARLEMGFAMNPTELSTFLGSMIPLVGLLEDATKVVTNGIQEWSELLGLMEENPYDQSPLFYHSSGYLVPGINQISKLADIYERDIRR